MLHGIANLFRFIAFARVDEVISFHQYLVIHAVDLIQGVMVPDQVDNTVGQGLRIASVPQKLRCQDSALRLLVFFCRAAVFLTAHRTGDIVEDRGHLQDFLRLAVKPFAFPDGPGVGPDLQKVFDIVQAAFAVIDHLFCKA
ncbi:hypothetical protein SDC9_160968 [bioreactor metagenome]|uniref:Uncharacterized protein n=1 Tax=bioreactor metagenome TaxID=1076179 RepID=A0A645FGV7_9ZZZZ